LRRVGQKRRALTARKRFWVQEKGSRFGGSGFRVKIDTIYTGNGKPFEILQVSGVGCQKILKPEH
jgi:hypothetical protein